MLKLIIADDERIIRETISTIINWKEYDIEVVGLCKNGMETYDMIMDETPDIVLTDIKMPKMNGLKMIETAIKDQIITLAEAEKLTAHANSIRVRFEEEGV